MEWDVLRARHMGSDSCLYSLPGGRSSFLYWLMFSLFPLTPFPPPLEAAASRFSLLVSPRVLHLLYLLLSKSCL